MTTSKNKTCLLIAPLSFYSYSEYIKTELTRIGYDVTISNDEYPANTLGKIMGKLNLPMLSWITKPKIRKKYLEGRKYDLTIIIKGRGMSPSLIKEIKKVSNKTIGYTYDSFKFHPHPKNWFKHLDAFFTFDYRDAENNNLEVVELFSSFPDNIPIKKHQYEVSGILRNHSERLLFVDKVLSALPQSERFIYIWEKNFVSFFQNFFKNPHLYLKYRKYIFFKPLSYQKYIDILNNSNFVIDFAHPHQSGNTIRCYEARSCGTKIITNNSFVFRDKHSNRQNTILLKNYRNTSALIESYNQIKNSTPKIYDRSIKTFVNDLLIKGGVID